ncbi:MAG: YkgJ family cysteine cluster protein [Desulfobacterales bacterium]
MTSNDAAPERMFECRLCGECCKGYGGTYLEPQDIEAIAAFTGIEPAVLMTDYCELSGGRPLLAQGPGGYCIFWDTVCTIHPVKPRMCRRWPFIAGVLVHPENWLAMASACPGMRTDVPLADVCRHVAAELASETLGPGRPASAQGDVRCPPTS